MRKILLIIVLLTIFFVVFAVAQEPQVEVVYTLSIPSIDVNTVLPDAVYDSESNEVDWSPLDDNYPVMVSAYTQKIGMPGTVVIFGHRQWGPIPKVFAHLDDISIGDYVFVATERFVRAYKVRDIQILWPGDVWPIISKENQRLKGIGDTGIVLVTCTPYGTSWQRIVVFAEIRKMKGGKRCCGLIE